MSTPPPIDKTLTGVLKQMAARLTLLERRTSKGPAAVNDGGRLSPVGQKITDWNQAKEVGFYWGLDALNAPLPIDGSTNNWFAGHVTYHGGNTPGQPRFFQEVREGRTAMHQVVYRRYWNNTSWTAWTTFEESTVLTTQDLNTVLVGGPYLQLSNTNATTARNYPVASRAGHLEVVSNISGTDFVMQTYTEYIPTTQNHSPRQWRRTFYNGTWYGWTVPEPTGGGTFNVTALPGSFEPGYTYGDGSGFPANLGTMEVVKVSDVRTVQRFNEKSGWQRVFHRTAVDDVTWGPWVLDSGDSDWKALTAQNAWVFATPAPSYRIRGDTCYLRGEFFGGANQTAVFTLPAEARPASRTAAMVARYATTSVPPFGTLAINTTGECTFNILGGTIPSASPGFTLLGISYLLD